MPKQIPEKYEEEAIVSEAAVAKQVEEMTGIPEQKYIKLNRKERRSREGKKAIAEAELQEKIKKMVQETNQRSVIAGYDAAWIDMYVNQVKPILGTSDPEEQGKHVKNLINAICDRFKRSMNKMYDIKHESDNNDLKLYDDMVTKIQNDMNEYVNSLDRKQVSDIKGENDNDTIKSE